MQSEVFGSNKMAMGPAAAAAQKPQPRIYKIFSPSMPDLAPRTPDGTGRTGTFEQRLHACKIRKLKPMGCVPLLLDWAAGCHPMFGTKHCIFFKATILRRILPQRSLLVRPIEERTQEMA